MIETFSNIKNALENNFQDQQLEPSHDNLGFIKREIEQSDLPIVHQSRLNCRGQPIIKRSTLDVSLSSKRISPLPTTRHEELSANCRKNLQNRHSILDSVVFKKENQDQPEYLLERNSVGDGQNDHVDGSSVQTFSDIVSKQNQHIKLKQKTDKESIEANFQLNLESLPEISKQSLVNIDQLLNASRIQAKDTKYSKNCNQTNSQSKPNQYQEQTHYVNKKVMAHRMKLKSLQRNETLNQLSVQLAHPSKDQNTISMCTRGTEHTSLEVPKDMELKINETVEIDDNSTPFLMSYPISVLENTRAPSTPSGFILDQDIQIVEIAKNNQNFVGRETKFKNQANETPVSTCNQINTSCKVAQKPLKHTKGAFSSDYGISREKLNSRCGTRQTHIKKLNSKNNQNSFVKDQTLEPTHPSSSSELNFGKNNLTCFQNIHELTPSCELQIQKKDPKTASDRYNRKQDTTSEFFKKTYDSREKHKHIIKTIKTQNAAKSAVKTANINGIVTGFVGKPPGSSSGLLQSRTLDTQTHLKVGVQQNGS